MLECAQQYPKQLSLIDHELRFLPHFHKMREVIHDENIFGQILRFEIDHVMEIPENRLWRCLLFSLFAVKILFLESN
jgi:predicted dehydrogenase